MPWQPAGTSAEITEERATDPVAEAAAEGGVLFHVARFGDVEVLVPPAFAARIRATKGQAP
jgi:hypothetical protein